MIIKDINLTGHSVLPLRCFPLGNFDCNDDCLDCFIYPTLSLSLASPHRTDEVRINVYF